MTTPPPQAPAGWYPDPSGSGQRYWDGNAWLDFNPPQPLQNLASANETSTTNVKCFNCQHVQSVWVELQTFTCEQCGQALKRQGAPVNQPAQLNMASAAGESADEDQLEAWLRKYGGPAGLLALGVIFFVIASAFKVEALVIPALACLGAGVFWLTRTRSAIPAPVTVSTTRQPDQVRQHQLQEYLSLYIATTRGRVESVTPYSAVVVHGQRVNHILHLLLSIFCCGFWLPIWLVIAVTGGERRTVISVDQCGNVTKTG